MALIEFPLETVDGWPPVDRETLTAHPDAHGHHVIDDVPVFVVDLSRGDMVEAQQDPDGRLHFVSRVALGGHSTFRVIALADAAAVESALAGLRVQGAVVEETSFPSLWAIDVPPTADLAGVRAALEEAAGRDVLEFEDPRTA